MSKPKVFDVCIVGSGPFGLFSAFLLSQKGLNVCVFEKNDRFFSHFSQSLLTFWPSLNDPPTRAEVAHGHDLALYLNAFCAKGISFFKENILKPLKSEHLFISVPCLRGGLKDFENEELIQAQKLSFGLENTKYKWTYKELENALVCINEIEFETRLIEACKKQNVSFIQQTVQNIEESQSSCNVQTPQEEYKSEIILLAGNYEIANILHKYKNILIPMSDILTHYHVDLTKYSDKINDTALRLSNGHIGICVKNRSSENTLQISITGPRFLLPGAGVGCILKKEDLQEKVILQIMNFHKTIIFPYLSEVLELNDKDFLVNEAKKSEHFIQIDCHPCDELPLLGEFGKFGKIIGFSGFLASGFSASALAAKIAQDFILNEKSVDLHVRLHPRRFKKNN